MNWKNELTELLQIKYPIVQAPMLGVSTPEMAAAISNAGGLGSVAVGGLSPQKTRELIQRTKELTSKPFAVNLFAHSVPAYDEQQVHDMKHLLVQLCARHDIPFEEKSFEPFHFYSYKDQVAILLQERISVISFTFGIPDDESMTAMKAAGSILTGTATCVKEALMLEARGADVITVQGIEAGGHRGTFIDDEPLPQVGLIALLTAIKDKTGKPLIAAGGICDGPSARAAMVVGAHAIQPGTLFIASEESAAIPAYKAAVQSAKDTDSTLTRAFSGRWARGLRNAFMSELDGMGLPIPPYPVQNSLTGKIRALAQQSNNKEMTNLWAGQCAYKARQGSARDIFNELVQAIENNLTAS